MSEDKTAEFGYPLALRLAREQLRSTDIERQCLNSGGWRTGAGNVLIDYLGQPYAISPPDGEVSPAAGGEVPIREKILILHYFTRARGTPLSNRLVTYKELPEAPNYYPVFSKRAIKPLLDHFGSEPERLLAVAVALGGWRVECGDIGVTIPAFPRVPVTLALWKGDEEFPPSGNVLFDSSVPDYLTTDDTNVLCETIAWRLVRLKGGAKG